MATIGVSKKKLGGLKKIRNKSRKFYVLVNSENI